jgi:hypothetical protein
MMYGRKPNWDNELSRFARRVVGEPYVWGRTDCATIVRYALRVIYGDQLELYWPEQWTGRIEAARAFHDMGGDWYKAFRRIGFSPVDRGKWPQGAVVTKSVVGRRPLGMLGIVTMRQVLTSYEGSGVVLVPIDVARTAAKLVDIRYG